MVLWVLAEDMRSLSQRQNPLITHGTSSSMSTNIFTSVPFSLQAPWEWCEAPKWMLLPQWVCTTAENPELREPKCQNGLQANLPALCSKGRHCLSLWTVKCTCPLLWKETLFCKAACYSNVFWKDDLEQSSCHFLRGVQRSKRPTRNCFPVRRL